MHLAYFEVILDFFDIHHVVCSMMCFLSGSNFHSITWQLTHCLVADVINTASCLMMDPQKCTTV